ncbi:MAG: hypothetical protein KatS3mg060_0727 [Dehalococcoidia bacterium]|jgi:hypothetical protein|nr:MAG: hypothetical protein KatS3mg060_0727 [Dehalococcoidia bacterium]
MRDPRTAIESIIARYNRRYERPHAVVEAERELLRELKLLGLPVEGPERLPGGPYRMRYRVGAVVIEGIVHIPDTIIKLRVVDEREQAESER